MAFKDYWKEKSYSVKGSLIGTIIALIPSLIYFIKIITAPPDISYDSAWWPLVILLCAIFITMLTGIGALIGWIIGKIKSK